MTTTTAAKTSPAVLVVVTTFAKFRSRPSHIPTTYMGVHSCCGSMIHLQLRQWSLPGVQPTFPVTPLACHFGFTTSQTQPRTQPSGPTPKFRHSKPNIGALVIRIGFGGILYYLSYKGTPTMILVLIQAPILHNAALCSRPPLALPSSLGTRGSATYGRRGTTGSLDHILRCG